MSVKISELPILDSLADNDVIAGVDTSANVTSKIEMATLKNYIDTNTQYTAGTNIDITNNVVSAPNVYNKTETDELLEEKDEQIEELQSEVDSLSTIFNAFPTESDEDESMTLDGTAEVKFKKFDLKGNTSQITYTGKNLLNLNLSKSVNQNGIAYSVASDGTITINGTATANVDIQYLNEALQTLANTKYCLNYIYVSGSLNGTIHVFNQDSSHGWNGWNMDLTASNSGHNVVTVTSFTTDMNMSGAKTIRVDNGAVLNNLKFKLQFTKSESADYDYEPYVGGTASPNPSYPQDIHVISGDNEINVAGKNLFSLGNRGAETVSGATFVLNGSEFSLNGTYTSTGNPLRDSKNNQVLYIGFFKAGTYHITSSVKEGSFTPPSGGAYNTYIRNTQIGSSSSQILQGGFNTSQTFTLTNDTPLYYHIYINKEGYVFNNLVVNIQIEKGSSSTDYEPYQGDAYNIDLPVENLLQCNLVSTTTGGVTITNNDDESFTLQGTSTAGIGRDIHGEITLKAGTYTFSADHLPAGVYISLANVSNTILNKATPSRTFTISTDTTYAKCLLWIDSGYTVNDTIKIQLEKGSKQNNFTPYGTTPIELCKIGNYQDYFYKDNGSWYLHKEIGKVVLNGSENWGKSSSTANTIFYLSGTINYKNGTTSSSTDLYCNYFEGKIVWERDVIGCELYTVNSIRFGLTTSSTITTIEDWKTWLSTHNTEAYYILATSTNTEITYEPLIDQLNLLEKAMSKDGQTNVSQVNNDKPFILDVTAIKSLQSVLDRVELLES